MQIALLKRMNRFAQMGVREYRERTKEKLQNSDEHFLKLQNLQYQVRTYIKISSKKLLKTYCL